MKTKSPSGSLGSATQPKLGSSASASLSEVWHPVRPPSSPLILQHSPDMSSRAVSFSPQHTRAIPHPTPSASRSKAAKTSYRSNSHRSPSGLDDERALRGTSAEKGVRSVVLPELLRRDETPISTFLSARSEPSLDAAARDRPDPLARSPPARDPLILRRAARRVPHLPDEQAQRSGAREAPFVRRCRRHFLIPSQPSRPHTLGATVLVLAMAAKDGRGLPGPAREERS